MDNEVSYIWEGIYDRFPKEDTDRIWNSEQWIDTLTKSMSSNLSEYEMGATITTTTLIHEYPLPLVVALLTATIEAPVCILDFGGGLGNNFLSLIASLPTPNIVEFHIVEKPKVNQQARRIYHKFNNLYFHNELPSHTEKFDIVHAGSSLHYIADWRSMLKQFASYKPLFIMLSGLTAGDIKTFVTYQKYYGLKIPVWFWNIHEVIDAVKVLGYTLVYKSLLASSYLGKIRPLPMENFPPEYQLQRKCNLIFVSDNRNNK